MVRVRKSAHPRYSHEVTWKEGGTRHRMLRAAKSEADALAAAVRERLKHMPPSEATLTREEIHAVLRARVLKVPLMEAVEAHAASAAVMARSVTVAELVERRLESLDRESVAHQNKTRGSLNLRRGLNHLANDLGGMHLARMDRAAVEKWIFLPGAAPETIRKRRWVLSGLLKFGKQLKLTDENMAESIRTPQIAECGDIAVLTPAEARDYLQACRDVAPAILAMEAVRMFAGLRKAESERLDWKEVLLDQGLIEVTAGKAKTKTRRLVDIQPALHAILGPLRKTGGLLKPPNYRNLRDRAVKTCGWTGDIHIRRKAKANARPWPRNCQRHSFVSYHLAQWNNAAQTALQAGHDVTMLFRHYRALVTPAAAAEFWAIRL